MAASEICSFLDQSCDDLNVDELLNIDSSLLMSFVEDSQEEKGGEMLRSMIQSLEPESTNQDSCSETYSSDYSSEECGFSEVDEVESCSTSLDHHPHFEWMDMEMDYSGYFIGRFTGNTVEIRGLEDYSQVCYGVAMEEDDYNIDLWQ